MSDTGLLAKNSCSLNLTSFKDADDLFGKSPS